jgi:hypothetical protein
MRHLKGARSSRGQDIRLAAPNYVDRLGGGLGLHLDRPAKGWCS